jgi:hypothetical protein
VKATLAECNASFRVYSNDAKTTHMDALRFECPCGCGYVHVEMLTPSFDGRHEQSATNVRVGQSIETITLGYAIAHVDSDGKRLNDGHAFYIRNGKFEPCDALIVNGRKPPLP